MRLPRTEDLGSFPRVVHVAPQIFDPSGRIAGGAERYALELARAMSERVPTRLVSFGEHDVRDRDGRLSIRLIGGARRVGRNPYNPFSRRVIRELLRADVVHCHQRDIFVSKIAALVRTAGHRPVFVTDHGGGAWDWTTRVGLRPRFDGYLHVSAFSRKTSGQNEDPRAHVVYAGVDLERFSPPTESQARDGVLFVGRILPHKGVDLLIEALPTGARLDIVGPVLDDRYLKLLVDLARGKDVHFHHDWADDKVKSAYQRAACVALPSVYRDRFGGESAVPELLGQTLLEGMACGAPALCTQVGGMPEVVADGATGFVVPPNDVEALCDRMTALLSQPRLVEELGDAGTRRVRETFSWRSVVERCLARYATSGT